MKTARNFQFLRCGYEKWLLLSFESTDDQGHADRCAYRFRCGASFIIPAIIGFLDGDVEDSHSSYSGDTDNYSSSSYEDSFDEDYLDIEYELDQGDWNENQDAHGYHHDY